MKKISSVSFYKPTETSTFEVGQFLMYDDKTTTIKVEEITVFGQTAKIKLSNQKNIIFKGLPLSYEI